MGRGLPLGGLYENRKNQCSGPKPASPALHHCWFNGLSMVSGALFEPGAELSAKAVLRATKSINHVPNQAPSHSRNGIRCVRKIKKHGKQVGIPKNRYVEVSSPPWDLSVLELEKALEAQFCWALKGGVIFQVENRMCWPQKSLERSRGRHSIF